MTMALYQNSITTRIEPFFIQMCHYIRLHYFQVRLSFFSCKLAQSPFQNSMKRDSNIYIELLGDRFLNIFLNWNVKKDCNQLR